MKDNHITDILDNAPLANLSESELRTIHAHAATCVDCARAFESASISALLIKERTGEAAQQTLNASPFFQTRVMAAWREQQTSVGAWSLRRLWNATGAIVASMAATTAALAVLTFAIPATDTSTQQIATAIVPASAETVVLDQDQNDNQMTNDQVINAIYADDDEGK